MSLSLHAGLLAALLAGARAACPNACSGHGTCDKFDRCACQLEGKTTYFGYLYDTAKGYNRLTIDTNLIPDALVPSAACYASSEFDAARACSMAFDDDVDSDWASFGEGVGSWIQSNFGGSYKVSSFGYRHRTYDEDNKQITLSFSDGTSQVFTLEDDLTTLQTFPLSPAVDTTFVRITVNLVWEVLNNGAREIKFYGKHLALGQVARHFSKGAFAQAQYTGADCSLMTCPRGVSWTRCHPKVGSEPTGKNAASNDVAGNGEGATKHQDFAECSDMGSCDRATGTCACFPGFEGPACQRTVCPNSCSGHGTCQSNVKFAEDGSTAHDNHAYLNAWDSGIQMGCKCDLGYRGADCAAIECPSSSDPLGWHGNGQGEDCSGRGLCDYNSGVCQCFSGFTGHDCGTISALI